ncbi:toxin YdaT domain-containing protein [Citrobacter sedlakii]|uniref:toxin YdaT domain-containing protein n=1 Tax=Citrobacter sedlakii TaxID=67826 RepID=UPI0022B4DDC9|nr:toxin YdaT domain-containing protein [Citrobacter sedlakii]MCZ4677240.1 toxin YdaT domain-containing protein [Citrobacter sedlakii]MDR5007297.1 toxin YdaT domain-containing protein [Citrobacter sedlakii]
MHSISLHQNTGFPPVAMINRNQPDQADKHDQIRTAVRAWSASLDNQDVVAGIIVEEWERQGGAGLVFPDDLSRKRQKLFRWLDSDTGYARDNIRQLTPAILAVLPLEFRGHLIGTDCFTTRYAAMEKEISEAKRAVMLNAPEHQLVKEVREGIEHLLTMLPGEAAVQVLSGIAAMVPGVMEKVL